MSNNENKSSNIISFLLGVVIGGVAGYVTGILLAPKSGIELRNDFSEGVEEFQHKTKNALDDTKNNFGEKISKSKQNLTETVKRISEAFKAGQEASKESLKESLETENSLDNTEMTETKVAEIENHDKIDELNENTNN